MDDYALHMARTSGSLPGVGIVERLINNWHARKAVRKLAELDDQLLHDVGLTRGDVDWASRLPLSANAALLLDGRHRTRRTKQHGR